MVTAKSTASPTLPEAQGILSRKLQTLLNIRIEAPSSSNSIQIIFFIFALWATAPPMVHGL